MKFYQAHLIDFATGEWSEFIGMFDSYEKAEDAIKAVSIMRGMAFDPSEADISVIEVNKNYVTGA